MKKFAIAALAAVVAAVSFAGVADARNHDEEWRRNGRQSDRHERFERRDFRQRDSDRGFRERRWHGDSHRYGWRDRRDHYWGGNPYWGGPSIVIAPSYNDYCYIKKVRYYDEFGDYLYTKRVRVCR